MFKLGDAHQLLLNGTTNNPNIWEDLPMDHSATLMQPIISTLQMNLGH
jgi:hypothetical protein